MDSIAESEGISYDREEAAEEFGASIESTMGPEAAKAVMQKNMTYLAAGKQTMYCNEKRRTKSWVTVTTKGYKGYDVKTKGAGQTDVIYYCSPSSQEYRNSTFLVFQSK